MPVTAMPVAMPPMPATAVVMTPRTTNEPAVIETTSATHLAVMVLMNQHDGVIRDGGSVRRIDRRGGSSSELQRERCDTGSDECV